jgi:hypothetical protein
MIEKGVGVRRRPVELYEDQIEDLFESSSLALHPMERRSPRRVLEARKAAGERAMQLIREAAHDEPELQDLVYASRVLDELNRKCQSARHSHFEA